MNTEEAFQIALSRHGKPLTSDAIHPDTAPGFDEFLRSFRNILSRSPNLAASNVYCDWINNLSFNAVATRYREHELIGIFAGAPLLIYDYFYSFLADPSTLPNVGNSSSEVVDRLGVAGLIKKDISILPRMPVDPIRRDAAMHLAWNAVMFLFFHEVAHIVQGHLQFLSEELGISHYLELPSFALSRDEARFRVLLELDADQGAAQNNIKHWRSLWDRNIFTALSPMSAETCWAISITMLFLIMDSRLRPDTRPQYTSHPPPMVRYINIVSLCTDPKRAEYVGPEDLFVEGTAEVRRWWAANKLPMSGSDHGLDKSTHNELNSLRKDLIENLSVRLDRYRDERFKK